MYTYIYIYIYERVVVVVVVVAVAVVVDGGVRHAGGGVSGINVWRCNNKSRKTKHDVTQRTIKQCVYVDSMH